MLQNPRLRSVPTRRTLFATLVTTLVLATPLVAATPTNTALEPAQFPDRAEYRGLWMDRNTFQDLLKNVPEFTQNLVRMLSGRLRMANEQIQSLSSLDVAGRLARQILAFAERYGQEEPGQGTRIPLRLTQSDLAELVGASPRAGQPGHGRLPPEELPRRRQLPPDPGAQGPGAHPALQVSARRAGRAALPDRLGRAVWTVPCHSWRGR